MSLTNRIDFLIRQVEEILSGEDDSVLSMKSSENKWSKKEIIGHLCDSAVNNLSRFIRAQIEIQPFAVIPYSQNKWVELNYYNEMKMNEIISYWQALNRQIIHVIRNMPEDKLAIICSIGSEAAFRENTDNNKTLFWLIEDYVFHMEHHLRQILEL